AASVGCEARTSIVAASIRETRIVPPDIRVSGSNGQECMLCGDLYQYEIAFLYRSMTEKWWHFRGDGFGAQNSAPLAPRLAHVRDRLAGSGLRPLPLRFSLADSARAHRAGRHLGRLVSLYAHRGERLRAVRARRHTIGTRCAGAVALSLACSPYAHG